MCSYRNLSSMKEFTVRLEMNPLKPNTCCSSSCCWTSLHSDRSHVSSQLPATPHFSFNLRLAVVCVIVIFISFAKPTLFYVHTKLYFFNFTYWLLCDSEDDDEDDDDGCLQLNIFLFCFRRTPLFCLWDFKAMITIHSVLHLFMSSL